MKALDPKAKVFLTAIAAASQPPIDSIPLEIAREQVDKAYSQMNIPVKPIDNVVNKVVRGSDSDIPVRIYTPIGQGPFPVIVYFHGGGWVFFHLDAYDPICTHLCASAGCIVVSVDYRLSPEFKFPTAINDCYEAALWTHDHCQEWNGNPASMFLAGDSAGGNLATVVSLKIRDEGVPTLKGQVLIYPVTDYWQPEKPSYVEFADGYGLSGSDMRWFWDKYLEKKEDASNPMAVPLLAPNLKRLPPAYIIVSGHDPLRDEGILYAERLKNAGVKVKLSVYEEMIHGFISYLGLFSQASTSIEEISEWIKDISKLSD
jgi:acetyl esterase